MFCVERRKAWRMLQSKAGIENRDYKAQRALLNDVDAGKVAKEDLFARGEEMIRERAKFFASAPGAAAPRHAATVPPAVAGAAAAKATSQTPAATT
jgi:hypothetical protein